MRSDEDDPGPRNEERRFPVVPGDPDDGRRWPEEPEDPDLGPDIPSAPTPDPSRADPQTRRVFWLLVVVLDVAILLVAVGLLFVGFEGRWTLGGQMVLGGLVLLGYGWWRYRRYKQSRDDSDADSE